MTEGTDNAVEEGSPSFELRTPTASTAPRALGPGALIELRDSVWRVQRVDREGSDRFIHCVGASGIVKEKRAIFIERFEPDLRVFDPVDIDLVPDLSSGFSDTKLFLEAAFRATPPTGPESLVIGQAAIDDLSFQHEPVRRALAQRRPRLLIADDVGLGKTLEAGLITAELILRRRASRILVITTRAMLTQFQKEFWTRFSIPLSRLDSAAIRKMRNEIPAHYNVFEQFDRVIVSVDTLKKDLQYRIALEQTRWDLVIIDEAHNVASRKNQSGTDSQRARLARLLSRRTDALLLLTATPHDGSQHSFASLVKMLDPTRVPNPEHLRREDIEDLVIRRFRSSPDVIAAIRSKVPGRTVRAIRFPLTPVEERAHELIAEIRLDLDEEARGSGKGGIDLFRTTLAKAVFSSPAACQETVEGRIKRIGARQARGTPGDVMVLQELADALQRIDAADFTKYQQLRALLKELKWTGRARRDRLVIFSERIRTLAWLEEHLMADLGLPPEAIGRIDGGSVEADVRTQKVLEDFGQENAPIRILLASDMASEGLNLHFQCHRLIHFDLPWSLLRFQQRNGRIDRYGQDRTPEIFYFVGESAHERVRDMWVLDKLVEKDEAAQQGVGDPAVFLGQGDAELEEAVVAAAVASGAGADAFSKEMDERVAESAAKHESDSDWDLLFGEYGGASAEHKVEEEAPPPYSPVTVPGGARPPRLYPDTFGYVHEMLDRLAQPDQRVLAEPPRVNLVERTIELKVPEDMKASDAFGYLRKGDVDDRFMPPEAVGPGERIELSDDAVVINTAIDQARGDERAWPRVQYLWDAHPMLDWLNDRASNFFGRQAAPACRVSGLAQGEVVVLLHGAIPNRVGTPVVDAWGVVRVRDGKAGPVEDVMSFLRDVGLTGQLPNRGDAAPDQLGAALGPAVATFQAHLVELRKRRAVQLEQAEMEALDRIAAFEGRFVDQLKLEFGDEADVAAGTDIQSRRKKSRREARLAEIREIFDDWARWHEDTCRLVDESHPFVDVKAVFGS